MNLDQAFEILKQVRARTGHRELVVIGSNASLALTGIVTIPADMTMSADMDAYTKLDPGRVFELMADLGEGSAFHREQGYFLDPVSPELPALPKGWQGRLIPVERDGGILWFLDPNDAAISKYARGEPRDRRWIQAGLISRIVDLARLRLLVVQTPFLDAAEEARAHAAIEEDARWMAAAPDRPKAPGPRTK